MIPFCVLEMGADYPFDSINSSTHTLLAFHRIDSSDRGRYWLFGAEPDLANFVRNAFITVAKEHVGIIETEAKGGIRTEESLRSFAKIQEGALLLIVSAANMGDMTTAQERDAYLLFGRLREAASLIPEGLSTYG